MKSIKYAKPMLKWAGGKSKIAARIISEIPEEYNTYYEPFVGGGAMFFELLKLKKFKRAVLGDSNFDLITTYEIIKNDVDNLIEELQNPAYKYKKSSFLKIREQKPISSLAQAARTIYLNKTCFNGLWRVNKSGQFNVPFGKFNNPLICDTENLRLVSTALKKVKFVHGDFDETLKKAKSGDLVYLDPPYIPLSKTSKFTSYNSKEFSVQDQWRLRGTFEQLVQKGVKVILTNSSAPLSYKLYSDYKIIEFNGQRNIGGPVSYRQPVTELMVIGELK